MAAQDKPKHKDWYKISVDTLRGWAIVIVFAVLGIGGFIAYRVLEQRYVEGKVGQTISEVRELIRTVRRDEGIEAYRDEFESAQQNLRAAERDRADGKFNGALRSAERSRVLLTTVLRGLHRLEASGEAQFISVQGDVEYRRGERGQWRRARSRDVLHAGDYVKTTGGSAEVVALDGTVYSVRRDTVIIVGESSLLSGGAAERKLQLDRGWVDLSTTLARNTVETPSATAEVERDSSAVVAYDIEEQVAKFAAYRGSVEVTADTGEVTRIGSMEHFSQTDGAFTTPKRLPAAPQPLDPTDEIEVLLSDADQLKLAWQGVGGVRRYALQVARNRLFVKKLIDVEDRDSTEATLGLRADGTFVWRVAAFSEEGMLGPWSTPRSFRVRTPEFVSENAVVGEPAPQEGSS